MAVTFGPIASAPAATLDNYGDYRVDLDAQRVYRNTDGRSWKAEGKVPDELLAALLTETTTKAHLARGVVVIAADQTNPPAGTPAGTVVYKRTS